MASEKFCYGPDDVFDDKNIKWWNNDYRNQSLKESYFTGSIDLIFLIVLIYVYLFPFSGELNSKIWVISFIVIFFSSMFFFVCYSTYLQAPIKIGFSNDRFYVIYRKKRKIKLYEITSLEWKNIKKITQVVSGGKGPSYEIDPRWNELRSPFWAGLKIITKKNIEYHIYNTSIKLMKEVISRSGIFKDEPFIESFVEPIKIKKRPFFMKSEEDFIERSNEYFENNEFPKAIKILKKTLKRYPTSANAFYLMGILTMKQNRTIALDYFDKAIKIKPNFKQAWFGKGLIFSSRLEFKKALICIEKILQLNQFDSTAINIKKDLLFYLRKNEELERFKKDIFKIRLIDPKGLLNMVLTSDKGKLIGAVAEINNQNLFLFPGEFINPLNYKTDKKGRVIFNKKNVTAIGDAIIYKSNSKSQSKKREIFQKEIIFDKVVLTTDGILLGDVKDIKQNKLIIRHGECVDFRKFQIDNEKCIILPVSGIISIDDIIIYQLPELDPYLIHKNHDEQSFIDQYFTSDYPEYLKIKF